MANETDVGGVEENETLGRGGKLRKRVWCIRKG